MGPERAPTLLFPAWPWNLHKGGPKEAAAGKVVSRIGGGRQGAVNQ